MAGRSASGSMPELVRPMQAGTGELPSGREWAVEFAWEGLRCVGYVRPGRVRLLTAGDRDVTTAFPELEAPLTRRTPRRGMVLDGTVVALGEGGLPRRRLLLRRSATQRPSEALVRRTPVGFFVSDLLWLDGRSTVELPYGRRRELLEELGLARPPVVVSPSFPADEAEPVMRTAEQYGAEALYAKHLDAPYRPGRRTRRWLRVPLRRTRQVVIGGWSPADPRRPDSVGALLLGSPTATGLRYVGRVGLGSGEERREIAELLAALRRPRSPFADVLPAAVARDARWVAPRLHGWVEFTEWTADGRLRLPVWRGICPPGDVDEARLALPPAVSGSGAAVVVPGAVAGGPAEPLAVPVPVVAPVAEPVPGSSPGSAEPPAGRAPGSAPGAGAGAGYSDAGRGSAEPAAPDGRRRETAAVDGRRRDTAAPDGRSRDAAEPRAVLPGPGSDLGDGGRSGTGPGSAEPGPAGPRPAEPGPAEPRPAGSGSGEPATAGPPTGASARPTAEPSSAELRSATGTTGAAAGAPGTPGAPDDDASETRRLRQHFVYNSLNTIASLVRTDPGRARDLLLGFADLTRAGDQPVGAPTTLGAEIAAVRAYLQLEQARFGERLRVEVSVDPALATVPLPAQQVLGAVQTTVQRSVEPRPEGGTVTVTAQHVGDECVVRVAHRGGEEPDAVPATEAAVVRLPLPARPARSGAAALAALFPG